MQLKGKLSKQYHRSTFSIYFNNVKRKVISAVGGTKNLPRVDPDIQTIVTFEHLQSLSAELKKNGPKISKSLDNIFQVLKKISE